MCFDESKLCSSDERSFRGDDADDASAGIDAFDAASLAPAGLAPASSCFAVFGSVLASSRKKTSFLGFYMGDNRGSDLVVLRENSVVGRKPGIELVVVVARVSTSHASRFPTSGVSLARAADSIPSVFPR